MAFFKALIDKRIFVTSRRVERKARILVLNLILLVLFVKRKSFFIGGLVLCSDKIFYY